MAVKRYFTHAAASGSNASTYTFTNCDFGNPALGGLIVVGVAGTAGSTAGITSVTIDGVAASHIVNASYGTGTRRESLGWFMIGATGNSSGNVVVNHNASMQRCGIVVYRIVGSSGVAMQPRFVTRWDLRSRYDVPAGGVVLGIAVITANATATWTGLVEDIDDALEGTDARYSSGSAEFSTATFNQLVECAWSSSNMRQAMASVMFVPPAQTPVVPPGVRFKARGSDGKVAIWRGSDDDGPFEDPLEHLGRVLFHSDLDYPVIVSQHSGTLSLPLRGAGSFTDATHTLFAHGRTGVPFVLGYAVVDGIRVPFAGSVPVQMHSTGWARWLNLGANDTNVVIQEQCGAPNSAAIPALSLDWVIFVTDLRVDE